MEVVHCSLQFQRPCFLHHEPQERNREANAVEDNKIGKLLKGKELAIKEDISTLSSVIYSLALIRAIVSAVDELLAQTFLADIPCHNRHTAPKL